jgi:hypothetical protein
MVDWQHRNKTDLPQGVHTVFRLAWPRYQDLTIRDLLPTNNRWIQVECSQDYGDSAEPCAALSVQCMCSKPNSSTTSDTWHHLLTATMHRKITVAPTAPMRKVCPSPKGIAYHPVLSKAHAKQEKYTT